MAFVDELKAVFIVVGRTIRDFFVTEDNALSRHIKQIAIALTLVLLGAAGYMGYRSYIAYREQKAHQSFADYLQDFQGALKSDNKEEWERVVSLFDHGYIQHKGSNLAPLFLSLKADAQIKLDNKIEAISTLGQAIDLLPARSVLLPLFKMKHALMQLDAQNEALSQAGLQQLVQIARDKDNELKDMALFWLGRYYWANDQIDEAKKSWQELEDNSWQHKAYPSPWVHEAQQKLKQLPA